MSQNKPHTILVVEDVEEISSNMKAALNKRGHLVVQASTAEQAIEMAETNRPAMILTDLELPVFETLLSLLRSHPELKNTVVAVIDINSPKIADDGVKVLNNFQALDDLIRSSQQEPL